MSDPVPTGRVAEILGKSEQYTRRILNRLVKRGLLERVGQRGGWKLTPAGKLFIQPPPHCQSARGGPDGSEHLSGEVVEKTGS